MANLEQPPPSTSSDPVQPVPPPVKIRHYIEAALAAVMMAVLKRFSLRLASSIGAGLARTIGPLTRPWRIAARNIARALPEKTPAERRTILRAAFDNFGRVMFEYAQLPKLWRSHWDGIIDVEGGGLAWAIQENKPSIVFTAHIGNWELLPMVLAAKGKPVMIVYRAPNNPLVDAMIAKVRAAYAAALAPKGAEGLRQIVEHIQEGGTVFMVVDQKTNTGPEIPFLGRGARTGKAVARIAMKYGCKLIPAHCERIEGARFRVVFDMPWSVEGNAANADHVTNTLIKLNAKIEDWVRATPGQWMWMHKRWPD
jgi:Kdo2-lipid IVA lauroyltransferase/acyltransferase